MPENSNELYKQRLEILTKVDVMPAQAPAASLPNTDSSPSFPLNNFWPKIKTLDSKWWNGIIKFSKLERQLGENLINFISKKLDSTIRYHPNNLEHPKGKTSNMTINIYRRNIDWRINMDSKYSIPGGDSPSSNP